MPEYSLGINSAYHESSACLVCDGELLAFVEEERLNRVRHGKQFAVDGSNVLPERAIAFCLESAGITMEAISAIGYSLDPELRIRRKLNHDYPYAIPQGNMGSTTGEAMFFLLNMSIEGEMRKRGFSGAFHYLPHHDCHAAGAYYTSGYDSAAVLVIDGIGEYSTATAYHAENTTLRQIFSLAYPNSLGLLWEEISLYLGFTRYDAAKVMGLASYGDPAPNRALFRKLITIDRDGGIHLDDGVARLSALDLSGLEELFGLPASTTSIKTFDSTSAEYANIAATLQEFTNEAVLALASRVRTMTGENRLCLSGGVALNCSSNAYLISKKIFSDVYVHPPSNDAGTAIGAAFLVSDVVTSGRRPNGLKHYYMGPVHSDHAIREVLESSGLEFEQHDNIEALTAQMLADGKIVAWFQGAMEAGPRALGHRSILADPRNPGMLDRINGRVKYRESFRPLGPSVLEEHVAEWFDIEGNIPEPTRYMLAAVQVRPDKKELIPAAVHVDGSSRVHVVTKEVTPRYWKLIHQFYKLTGIPLVINTSFNIQEPIVCTPADAIATFERSYMDYLVIGDYVCRHSVERHSLKYTNFNSVTFSWQA